MSTPEQTTDTSPETFECWTFPEIESTPPSTLLASSAEPISITLPEKPIQPTEDPALIALKQSLQDQITLLAAIHKQMEQLLHAVDESLLQDIITSVHRITHKIIHKELADDPDLLRISIQNFVKELKPFQHCTISLSAQDYEQCASSNLQESGIRCETATDLKKGDYRIITPHAEIVACLEKRLAAFFGLPA